MASLMKKSVQKMCHRETRLIRNGLGASAFPARSGIVTSFAFCGILGTEEIFNNNKTVKKWNLDVRPFAVRFSSCVNCGLGRQLSQTKDVVFMILFFLKINLVMDKFIEILFTSHPI